MPINTSVYIPELEHKNWGLHEENNKLRDLLNGLLKVGAELRAEAICQEPFQDEESRDILTAYDAKAELVWSVLNAN